MLSMDCESEIKIYYYNYYYYYYIFCGCIQFTLKNDVRAARASHVYPAAVGDWTEFWSNIKLPGKFSFNHHISVHSQ